VLRTPLIRIQVLSEEICAYKLAGKLKESGQLLIVEHVHDCHYCVYFRNIIHGSDSVESAKKEIALWFDSKELVAYNLNSESWIYEH